MAVSVVVRYLRPCIMVLCGDSWVVAVERYIRRRVLTLALGQCFLSLAGFTAPCALPSTLRFDWTFPSRNQPLSNSYDLFSTMSPYSSTIFQISITTYSYFHSLSKLVADGPVARLAGSGCKLQFPTPSKITIFDSDFLNINL